MNKSNTEKQEGDVGKLVKRLRQLNSANYFGLVAVNFRQAADTIEALHAQLDEAREKMLAIVEDNKRLEAEARWERGE